MKHFYVFVTLSLCFWGSLAPISSLAQVLPPNQPEQDCIGPIPICSPIISVPLSYQGQGASANEINPSISCLGTGEINSVWFELSIQDSGIVDFLLIPNNPTEDYDWAIYNLSNASCSDIFNNPSLEVSCNYSGVPGNTGPSSTAFPGGPINAPITVLAGETYVLNVSNFTGSSAGFTLDFSNTNVLAFDTTQISINLITNLPSLNGLLLVLAEPILCAEIDTSDFEVRDPNGNLVPSIAAMPYNCDSSYTDSISLFFDPQISLNQMLTFIVELNPGIYYPCSQPVSNPMPLALTNLNTAIIVQNLGTGPTLCNGDSVLLSHTFSGLSGFQSTWMPGNIQADQLMVQADAGSSYSVSTQFAQNGLTGTDSIELSAVALPTWTPLADTSSCATTLLIGSNDSSLTYLWSNNSTSPSFVIDSSQGGTYTLAVSNANGCTVFDTLLVSFLPEPAFQPSFTIGANPLDVLFTSNASNVDSIYWDFGDGNTATGLNPPHSYIASGSYQVLITAYSPCGNLQDSIDLQVFATALANEYIPQAQLWINQQNLYLEIERFKASHYQLQLSDLNGRLVLAPQRIVDHHHQWDISHLSEGMYLSRLLDPEGNIVLTLKVIKL
ncbi:MAG: PKD domain-containing protein [Bacteroidota bacterium]